MSTTNEGSPVANDRSSVVALAILERLLIDRRHGVLRSGADYAAMFPGHEATVLAELARHAAAKTGGGAADVRWIGRYRVLRTLGRGGQGVVYLAEDERLHRRVAVKVLTSLGGLPRVALARFRLEAETASRLAHPGLCTVYDIDEHDGVPFIAMQHVEGESLLRHCSALPVVERRHATLRLFERVAQALHHAHEAGFVHRDVKPGNILVTTTGDPIVIDFGLARSVDADAAGLTRPGELFGTPAYLAPEQILAQSPLADRRIDVWALGVSLFEVLSGGQRPFSAPTYEALCRTITDENPADLRRVAGIDSDLAIVVSTALAKDPAIRYATAADLAADLARARTGEPIRAKPVTAWMRTRYWARRNPALAASLAGTLLVLLLGTLVSMWFATRAGASAAEWARLADLRVVEQLQVEADVDLWPPTPDRLGQFRDWLARAEGLRQRLPEHRAHLERLRSHALPAMQADLAGAGRPADRARLEEIAGDRTFAATSSTSLAERVARLTGVVEARLSDGAALDPMDLDALRLALARELLERARVVTDNEAERAVEEVALRNRLDERVVWRFATDEQQFRHDQMTALVAAVEALHEGSSGTAAGIRSRQSKATAMEARLAAEDAAAWLRCRDDVARADSAYRGLALEPIPGLVPLGIDNRSGLWEFWHVLTGDRPRWNGVPLGPGEVQLGSEAREGIVLVLLPGGSFFMGAAPPESALQNPDPRAQPTEWPPHAVSLAPFLLSKYEVTHAQWLTLANSNDSFLAPGTPSRVGVEIDARHPALSMTWQEAREFCRRLDLDLPTEAQWEYGCRAGTTSPFATGDTVESLLGYANLCDASRVRKYPALLNQSVIDVRPVDFDDGWVETSPIGSLRANGFGLHDLCGNAAEWCRDRFYLYEERPPRPGDGLRGTVESNRERVARPSCMNLPDVYARSAARLNPMPEDRWPFLGFRPMRGLDPRRAAPRRRSWGLQKMRPRSLLSSRSVLMKGCPGVVEDRAVAISAAPSTPESTMPTRITLLAFLVVLCPFFASCASTAKFKATSTAISFNRNLPAHPDCLPGSLELRVFADMLDDPEFQSSLGSSLRAKAGDMFTASGRTAEQQGKKAHYVIRITQMTENSKFDGNEEAAIYGALFGGAGGAVAARNNRIAGGVGGAAAGAGLAYLALGEKKRQYHFLVNIEQMTSAVGRDVLDSSTNTSNRAASGSKDEDVGTVVGTGENAVVRSASKFDVASNYFKQVGSFMVSAEGGAFSSEADAIASAKKAIVEKLPGFLTGGSLIDF